MSGGRGGMFLLISYTVALFCTGKHKSRFVVICAMIVLLIILIYPYMSSDLIQRGFNRIFWFMGNSELNSSVEARQYYLSQALALIGNRPILGYGLFGYLNYMNNYPHNILLEVMLQGGLLYLVFATVILAILAKNYHVHRRVNPESKIIGVLFLFPIVELLFSGTYMSTPLFWFGISYILCVKN